MGAPNERCRITVYGRPGQPATGNPVEGEDVDVRVHAMVHGRGDEPGCTVLDVAAEDVAYVEERLDADNDVASYRTGPTPHPARAAYGSTPVKMLLRLSEDMDRALRAAAVREGVSTSEYVRRAVAAALGAVNSTDGV